MRENFHQSTMIQKVEQFWDERPCNIRHSPSAAGTRQYFDEVEARKYFVEPHIPKFAEFDRWHNKRVLEIGCGIGTDTMNFARKGASVTAVELSRRSLDMARQRAKVYQLENQIRFYHANAEELTQVVPIEPYDLIYSFGAIHHTPAPERVLGQIRSYVRPGSTVKIMVYHRYSWKVLWIVLKFGKGRFWQVSKLIAHYSEAQEGCPVTFAFTKTAMRRLLASYGFEITEMWVDHIFPYRIKDYLQYRYNRVWYFRWMPQSFFRWIERHWGWHLCVTAVVT